MLVIPTLTWVIIFSVAVLYGATGVLLTREVIRRFSRNPALARRPFLMWARRIVFGLAAAGLLCFAYALFIEPVWVEVTHVRLTSDKLPASNRPIRFVQISDLHSEATARTEERLPDIIARQKPDFVVFTGDTVNSIEGLTTFKRCMTRIAQVAPVYAVKGNWDVWRFEAKEITDFFGGTGVRELQGETAKVNVGGTTIWLAGAGCWSKTDLLAAIATIPHDSFSIALYHHPDLIPDIADTGVDLLCAGHLHGGQVAVPGFGGLIKVKGPASIYERGLFRVKNTWVYVSRGIGMEGGHTPRIRFFSRPEVTVFEIAPAGK